MDKGSFINLTIKMGGGEGQPNNQYGSQGGGGVKQKIMHHKIGEIFAIIFIFSPKMVTHQKIVIHKSCYLLWAGGSAK